MVLNIKGHVDMVRTYRELLESDEITIAPSVYDGISAKLVESMGFETAIISGAAVSNSRLGKPDVGFLDLTLNADQTEALVESVDIPLLADGDTGYGNAMNVYNTIETLERTGVSAIMLEDQQWPKRCGHMEGKSVIPMEDMIRKIEAAVDARRDPELVIKARTDTADSHGVDEAIRRLNAYTDAGADFVFADKILSKEDMRKVCQETKAPCSINMGYGIKERSTTPLVTARELEEMGAAMVMYPRLITGAAVKGMQIAHETLLDVIYNDEVVTEPDQTVGFEEYTSMMGLPEYEEMEQKFGEIDTDVDGR